MKDRKALGFNLKELSMFSRIRRIRSLLHKTDIRVGYLILPVFLSVGVAFFEGVSVIFLIPLAKGIIQLDFTFVRDFPAFDILFDAFPGLGRAHNTAIFVLLVGIVFFSAIIKNILFYLSVVTTSLQIRKFTNGVRRIIFERYLSFGKLFFDRNNIGYLQTVLINFTSLIAGQLRIAQSIFAQFFMLIIYVAIMVRISWRLTICALIIFPVLTSAVGWIIKKIKEISGLYKTAAGDLSNNIYNILSCMPLVKLYSQEGGEKKRFRALNEQLGRIEFNLDRETSLIGPIQDVIMLVLILFLISIMAFMVVREKSASVASFLIFFYVIRRAQGAFSSINNLRVSLARVKGPLSVINKILNDDDKFFVTGGSVEFKGLKERMEFQNLTFSYIKGHDVLKGLNFSVAKGQKCAIVGPTGSGKTTLIHLLLRFYDCQNSSIIIDGIDIKKFTLKSLLAHVAFVSQDVLLFNDTLKANIIYGQDKNISDSELISVIKKARLHDFVIDLPDGLNTKIGDRGVRLSGGEKQRVSIARALLKKSEILILDEATSSLDSKTEKLVQEAINEAMTGKTAIVIAHRLSTIKNVDKIVIVENGRSAEEGSLSELLDKKGKFYEYWEEQKFY